MENNYKRTDYCGLLRTQDIGKEVTVCGWVQRMRNLGGLIFIDLRDRFGIIQCTFDETVHSKELFDAAFAVRSEYVLSISGKVRKRGGAVNEKIETGDIEIDVSSLTVLSKAQTTPFEIVENSEANEALRLKYRYLDLRRPEMQKTIALRHKVTSVTRNFFDQNRFLEIETPILTKSTPEGARDYLVPSRVQPGKFFALPQSPQQYKQLLMVAGFDRYMQIVRCFRDEDLRAHRQPEFTQIDLEMSFVDVEDVIAINEAFLKTLFKQILDVDVQTPLPRLTYEQAMTRFGSDKPDLRFGFELCDISELLKNCEFKVFSGAISGGGSVRLINVDGYANKFTRKDIDALTEYVKTYKAKGLAWLKMQDGETSSSFAKFLTPEETASILKAANAKDGDLILVVADTDNDIVMTALGELRCEVAKRLDILKSDDYKLAWVTEFPLFEYDPEEGRLFAKHHPFTSPMDSDVELLKTSPEKARAKAYDVVINGVEAGGGSVRIFNPELQETMFAALGFTKEQATEQFGHLIEAFSYGAPPHAGFAYGLDRLIMLLSGRESIRDVIAFPKVQTSSELMMQSPSEVDLKQLDLLNIQLKNN